MKHVPLADRGPLRVLFAVTSMPVGGAETLLVHLVRHLNPDLFAPEIVCLKERGPLGDMLADEMPVHCGLIKSKWDVRVLGRLRTLIRERRLDAIVTVGAGDKMFWGRLAAHLEDLPVVFSALHSTGWPDGIGFLNRRLTPMTDVFIAVARPHGRYLVETERLPASKVRVIPNGVDTDVFRPNEDSRDRVRRELGIPLDSPVVGIVAALRPEKNHAMFLQAAARLRARHGDVQFIVTGDGPARAELERTASALELDSCVHFLGTRSDIPRILAAMDVFALTSLNEASPVSILEALACEVPVVATRVGSVSEFVIPGETGNLVASGDVEEMTNRVSELLGNHELRHRLGMRGRSLVRESGSLAAMVRGYEELLREIYQSKCRNSTGHRSSTTEDLAVGTGSSDFHPSM